TKRARTSRPRSPSLCSISLTCSVSSRSRGRRALGVSYGASRAPRRRVRGSRSIDWAIDKKNYTCGSRGASTRHKRAAGTGRIFKAPPRARRTLRRPHERIEAMHEPRRIDVAALGELVVDLIPARAADGSACLAPKPGGAPGNVAVGVARLGGHAAMLSKVGDDAFGRLLIETLTANGVGTEAVLTTQAGATSIAVVTVAPDGEREFLIYRKGSADSIYAAEDVAADVIRSARILHVGSLWLGEPICGAA